MKPVNFDSQPCNPISSNCVVWQGPDIPCIALCTGDTVSDVVAALATELCTVLDTLNVDNYDLSCFNITNCKPKDFIALIDFLTKQICDLQNVTPTEKSKSGCPDCMLSVPECLNAPQSVMNLAEYVNFLATKICGIIGDVADVNIRVDQLENRVTTIENNCCDDTPPPPLMVNVDCPIPTVGEFEITQALEAFLNDFFCNFYQYTTGTITQLESAIASQCISNTDPTKFDPLQVYGNLSGWVNAPGTVADTIRNIWLVICDLYTQTSSTYDVQGANTQYINTNVTYTGTNPVVFTVSSTMIDTGWQYLVVPNPANPTTQIRIPSVAVIANAPMVRRIGNMLYFKGVYAIPIGDNTLGNGGAIVNQTTPSLDAYNFLAKGYTYDFRYATGAGAVEACQILTPYDGVGLPQPAGSAHSTNHGSRLLMFNNNNILPDGILGTNETLTPIAANSNIMTHELWRQAPCSGNVTTGFAMWSRAYIGFEAKAGTGPANGARMILVSGWNYEQYHRTGSIPYLSTMRHFCSHAVNGEPIPYLNGGIVGTINGPQGPNTTSTSYNVLGNTLDYAASVADKVLPAGYSNQVPKYVHDQDTMDTFQMGGLQFRLDGMTAFIQPCADGPYNTINACPTT